ncbi:MAG: amidohydrolase family protein [Eubacteriales bacterium]|nr:amidohydrolase family protein [Eubacteriales bacterium]
MADYVIKNGTVYVPGTGRFEKRDLYVSEGLMADGKALSEECKVIDAAGCYVTAGFVDYHVHYFKGGADNGVDPDMASFPNGVTTAVDGGTCGVSSFEIFKRAVIDRADTGLFAQLLTASGGQLTERYMERLDAELIDGERIAAMFKRFPDVLAGLKTRISANIIEPEKARASLERSVELAEQLGCNLTVHITNPAMDLEEMAGILRKGDVMCHIFQNKGRENILDEDGNVRGGIWKARERGVLFDACNGRSNFDLKVARAALSQGFFPDIISSDINTCSYYEGVLHSLPRVLSKYLAFGQPLERILDAAIFAPAQVIGHPELASLEAGTPADLVIFRVEDHPMVYLDHTNGANRLEGNQAIVPQLTMKAGKVVYSQVWFGA